MEQIDCNCTVVTIVVNLNDNFTHTDRQGGQAATGTDLHNTSVSL